MSNNMAEIVSLAFMDPFPVVGSLDMSGTIILWGPIKQGNQGFEVMDALAKIELGKGNWNQMKLDCVTQEDLETMLESDQE